mmetsp:Transcript_84814/g.274733  ORF Transcript_84814/g.274733 Transcript_84814/m.274733 type:complete len:290 (+) Transcript_84814:109-978(+)
MVKAAKKELGSLTWCISTLLLLYVVGGGVFSWLERGAELEHYQRNRLFYRQMRDMYEFDKCEEEWFRSTAFCRRQQEFSRVLERFFERSGNEMRDREKWTFFGSVFFVSTLVTTLGYGNFHPRTPGGQLFTVAFGLIGIPLMGYVLSRVGSFVAEVWMPMCPSIETKTRRLVVLCSLLVVFILLGGLLFFLLEGWPFLAACYFSALTLMSVGFGDLLPTSTPSRLATMLFVMLGLGVAASFIALLQLHVEVRGERFARHLSSWYGAVAAECGRGPAEGPLGGGGTPARS